MSLMVVIVLQLLSSALTPRRSLILLFVLDMVLILTLLTVDLSLGTSLYALLWLLTVVGFLDLMLLLRLVS